MIKHQFREQWLAAALIPIKKLFAAAKYTVPELRVACGWPSHGGTSRKKRCIGEAWSTEASADGLPQIFISPYLADPVEPCGVLATLVHEVVHATVGNKEKHNKVFGKCARAVGLEGKLTATTASQILIADFKDWMAELGDYPHAKLDLTCSPIKKQTTRMIKLECQECGYVARTSKKWIDDVGPAHCPKHGEMTFELPEGSDE